MKRRALLAAPLALLFGAKSSGPVSLGSYQFKPGEAERFAAALAANEKWIAEHNSRVSTIVGDEWPIPIPHDMPPGPTVSFDL